MSSKEALAQRPDSAHRLWQLWRQGQQPSLQEYLARTGEIPPSQFVAVLRVDQRERWLLGDRVTAETYLSHFPHVRENPAQALDLIYAEFLVREELGEKPAVEDFARRFPEFASDFRLQVEWHHALTATASEARHDSEELASREKQKFPGGPAASSRQANSLTTVPGYELLAILGQGGMGVVYEAWQTGLKRRVALKMLQDRGHDDPEQSLRFRAEAEAVARLQHPNIVQIYEVGEQDGRRYFTLELIEGGNLERRFGGTPQPARQAAGLVQKLARAMHAAHDQGIVHRDLKPANVLLTADGTPKITDFGLAKQLDADGPQTRSGAILGTPSFMAPEQAEGRTLQIGPVTDVYALGAILYQLLTGQPPFKGATVLETLEQVRSQEPVSPRRLQPNLPRDLETICLKCLEKQQARRYASALDLAEELGRFLEHLPIRARPVGALARLGRWCQRNPLLAGMAGSVGLLTLIIAVGASVAALGLLAERRQRDQALGDLRLAEQDAQEKLWNAYLARAQAGRWSGRAGRRSEGLAVLADAAEIAAALNLDEARWRSMRNEAIACLGLVDFRIGKRWQGYPAGSNGLAFDLRYERYARSDSKGNITMRRVADDGEIVRLAGLAGADLTALQFSRDGRFLIARSPNLRDSRTYLWDLSCDQPSPHILPPVSNAAWDFSPGGRFVALGLVDGSISLVNAATGKEASHLPPGISANQMVFDPRGRRLAISSITSSGVEIRHTYSGQLLKWLPHMSFVHGLAWHKDGKTLATACADNNIYLWDADSGERAALLVGHQDDVTTVAFSPDGTLLASSGKDDTIRLWDWRTGKQLVSAAGSGRVAFSPDGRYLGAALTGTTIGLCELCISDEFRELRGHEGPAGGPWGVEFSPDGRLLASASSDVVKLWEVATGTEVAGLPLRYSRSVVFEPGGEGLLSYNHVRLGRWPIVPPLREARDRVRLGPPENLFVSEHPDRLGRVCCAADGETVALTDPGADQVIIFNLRRPQQRRFFKGMPHLSFVAISPDARWVAAGTLHGEEVKVWNTASGEAVKNLVTGEACVAFSPDGKWLITGSANEYCSWRVGTWAPALRIPRERAGAPGPVAFTRDGRLMAIARSRVEAALIDPVSAAEIATLAAPEPRMIAALAFSPDGTRLAVGCENHVLQLWNLGLIQAALAQGKLNGGLPPIATAFRPSAPPRLQADLEHDPAEIRRFLGHRDMVWSVALSRDSRFALSGSGGKHSDGQWFTGSDFTIRLWDVQSAEERRRLEGHTGHVKGVAFSLDGKQAFSCSNDRTVRHWDLASGKERKRFQGHTGVVRTLAVSHDGRRLLGGTDQFPNAGGELWLWDIDSGKVLRHLRNDSGCVNAVAFSPDGRFAVSAGSDKLARLWDLDTGNEIRRFDGHHGDTTSVAFCPTGKKLITAGGDATVCLWDADSAKLLRRFTGHMEAVSSVACSPDGHAIISASLDGTLRVWDADTGRQQRCCEAQANWLTSVVISTEGHLVLSGSADGALRLWDFPELYSSNGRISTSKTTAQ